MSLQYLADVESSINATGADEVVSTIWISQDLVVTGSLDGQLEAWHSTTGRSLGKPEDTNHRVCVHSLSYSPHTEVLLTAAIDGTVALWDASSAAEKVESAVRQYKDVSETLSGVVQQAVNSSSSSQPKTQLPEWPFNLITSYVIGRKGKDRLEDPAGAERVKAKTASYAAAIHPTENYFAITGLKARVALYSFDRGNVKAALDELNVFDSDEDEIEREANQMGGESVRQRSDATRKEKDFGLVLAYNKSATHLAVGTLEGRVYVYDVHTGRKVATLSSHSMAVRALDYTAKEQLIVGCVDGMITVYDERGPFYQFDSQGELLPDPSADNFTQNISSQYTGGGSLTNGSRTAPNSLTSQSNSQDTTNAGAYSFVKRWDSQSAWITDVKASPDGRFVVASSIDGSIRIWDAGSEGSVLLLSSLRQEKEVWSLSWKPISQAAAAGPSQAHGDGSLPAFTGAISATAQSAQTASAFVAGGGDGMVRWYRTAGSSAA